MEVVVTTGAIRFTKLQSNHHHQQTNTQTGICSLAEWRQQIVIKSRTLWTSTVLINSSIEEGTKYLLRVITKTSTLNKDVHDGEWTLGLDVLTMHWDSTEWRQYDKISPVGDWRSTSLEWPWPWPWIRPYSISSCVTHRPLPTYQISLRSEEKFFRSHHWGFGQIQSHVTQKLGQKYQKSGPIKFRYCALV